jgi:hypothetical protein
MSKITIVRYETGPESADENQQIIEGVMAEPAHHRPEGRTGGQDAAAGK